MVVVLLLRTVAVLVRAHRIVGPLVQDAALEVARVGLEDRHLP